MNERGLAEPPASAGASPGALLRQARVAQKVEIAALAAAIKVTPRKLELLESDRFDELHDVTFVRALAQTVCRSLRIDAAPVMALLPQAKGMRLDQMSQGLNTPYRERPEGMLLKDFSWLAKPMVWAPALIVLAAAALYWMPADLIGPPKTVTRVIPSVNSGASAAEAIAPPVPVVETVYSAPAPTASASAPAVAMVSGLLQVRTTSQSWVEVQDARGQLLLSRVIQPGETVGLDGPLPLKVKIGNAAGTQLVFRGEPVTLSAFTQGNVSRLELK